MRNGLFIEDEVTVELGDIVWLLEQAEGTQKTVDAYVTAAETAFNHLASIAEALVAQLDAAGIQPAYDPMAEVETYWGEVAGIVTDTASEWVSACGFL